MREGLDAALERSSEWLLARQHGDGHWVGELEGDTILESEYVLLLAFLGRESEPVCASGVPLYPGSPASRWRLGDLPGRAGRGQRLGEGVLRAQAGWACRPTIRRWSGRGRPSSMRAGRSACNSFTRFYLALLGQIGYDECPSVPPELVLLPSWLNFSLSGDVGVDANDRRAAVDHVGFQAGAAAGPERRDRRAVSGPTCGAALAANGAVWSPGRTSSWRSIACSSGPTAGVPAVVAAAGDPGSAPLDARRTSRTPTAWARSSRR